MTRRSWLAAGLVIAVAATLTWFLVLRDDGNAAVGERLDLAHAVSGTDLTILVPNGAWQLTIAEPTDELDAEELADPTAAELAAEDTLRAPDGGALLRVAASYVAQPADLPDPSTVVPLDLAQVLVGTAAPLPLPIVEQPAGLPPAGWVFVIPGAADDVSLDDVRVRLGVDGATQTVSVTGASDDELGEAAALYDPVAPTAAVECDLAALPEVVGASPGGHCSAALRRTPYLPELGWAGEDQMWTLASADLLVYDWIDLNGQRVRCDSAELSAQVTVGGLPADSVDSDPGGNDRWRLFAAVRTTATLPAELTIGLSFSCDLDDPASDGSTTAEASSETSYPLTWT